MSIQPKPLSPDRWENIQATRKHVADNLSKRGALGKVYLRETEELMAHIAYLEEEIRRLQSENESLQADNFDNPCLLDRILREG